VGWGRITSPISATPGPDNADGTAHVNIAGGQNNEDRINVATGLHRTSPSFNHTPVKYRALADFRKL
jgi:hypothetical protein